MKPLSRKTLLRFLSIVFALERTNQLSLLPDKDLVHLCLPIKPYQVTKNHNKEKGKFIVLDGKQRLLTILQFYGDSATPNNSFTLKDLEFIDNLNGCQYQNLKNDFNLNDILDQLDNQTIRTIVIRNWKTESFLHKIFLRLNVENTPLSSQELRQALHPGGFINFLDDRAIESQALKKIFKSSAADFWMRDTDILLRYVAFHYYLSDYRGNLKGFLDNACVSRLF